MDARLGWFRIAWPLGTAAALALLSAGACGPDDEPARRPVWGWREAGWHRDPGGANEPTPTFREGEGGAPGLDPPEGGPGLRLDRLAEGDARGAVHGFPALSEDGRLVAVAAIDDTLASGAPNLEVRLLDPAGRKRPRAISVLNVAEGEVLLRDPAAWSRLGPGAVARAEEVRALLAAGRFRPMASLGLDEVELVPGEDAAVEAEGLAVRWESRASRLVLAEGAREKLALPLPRGKGRFRFCDDGGFDPLPAAAHLGHDGRTVVVRVAYLGNDRCEQPPDEHLIRRFLPRPRPRGR